MRKILIFSLAYSPLIGGAEISVKEITDRIPSTRFDMVTVRFDKSTPTFERIGNINVYRVGFVCTHSYKKGLGKIILTLNKALFPFLACFKAHFLEKENVYDAAWSIMANHAGFAALFFSLFNKKTPYILTLQEGDPLGYIKRKTRFVRPIFKKIFTRATIVQAISNYLAGFARSQGVTDQIVVIPNGVDAKHFSKKFSDSELYALKQKLGKKAGDVFLITVSRLVVKNGVDQIIRSLTHLPENVKLVIVGTGNEEESLRQLAATKKVGDRVIFVGAIPYREVPLYLKVSDIFVRPSRSEGFGNSFIEAMAAGIPVIASPVGGIIDFLYAPQEGISNKYQKPTGLFCDPHKPKTIADEVIKLLQDDGLKNMLVENGKSLALGKYDWDSIAKHMEKKVFTAVIKNK